MPGERIEVDVFTGHSQATVVIVAAAALSLSGANPIGGALTTALETISLHKGLQQVNGMAIFGLPIGAQTPSRQA